jgi:hypothetical protein
VRGEGAVGAWRGRDACEARARRLRGQGAAVLSRARADAPVVELQSSTFGPFWLQDLALAWRKIAKVNAQLVEG